MPIRSLDGLTKSNIKKIHKPQIRINIIKADRGDSIVKRPALHQKAASLAYYKPSRQVIRQAHSKRQAGWSLKFVKNWSATALRYLERNFKPGISAAIKYFNVAGLREKWNWLYGQKRVPVLAAVAALFLAFGGGVWATLNTSKSQADQPAALGSQSSLIPLAGTGTFGPIDNVPNQVLFNMTIDQLENYLADAVTNPQVKEAQILADRKAKLKEYLTEKNSPLVSIVDTIAELKHWKMVLAISNSESSLGKHCADENCSGIGIEPGNPLWRTYPSKAEWAKDLDKLLEKRYKDWTLEQMNGVYNKPGSQNWLLASKQILEDLQERGIE